jgi:hypothetical protein
MYKVNHLDDNASESLIIVHSQVPVLIIYELNDIITTDQKKKGIAPTSRKLVTSIIPQIKASA